MRTRAEKLAQMRRYYHANKHIIKARKELIKFKKRERKIKEAAKKPVIILPVYEKAETVNEATMKITQRYCAKFGCGRKLTRIETLCGNKCLNHQ